MNLLCPVCHAPISYTHEVRHCDACGWKHKTKKYSHIKISASDPMWISSDTLPEYLQQGYQHIKEIFTTESSFLLCSLTLRQYIQQMITFPILIAGRVIYDKSPGFSITVNSSTTLTSWSKAIELIASEKEIHNYPTVEHLLFEVKTYIETLDENALLPEGMLSLSAVSAKQALIWVLENTLRLTLTLSEYYNRIKISQNKSEYSSKLTVDGTECELCGVYKKDGTYYILTHVLDSKTAACASISAPEFELIPMPPILNITNEAETPISPLANAPVNPSLMRRIYNSINSMGKKGILALHTETDMGTPGQLDGNEKIGIVFDASRHTLNHGMDLLDTVASNCKADIELIRSIEDISYSALIKLLSHIHANENKDTILVIANAYAYTDTGIPLKELSSADLPDGVFIVLHNADHTFSYPADAEITVSATNGLQSAFLFDYLQNNDPTKAIEPPFLRNERLASYVAAAQGSLSQAYITTSFHNFSQSPTERELIYINDSRKIFLQIMGELYEGYEELLVLILTLCESVIIEHTLSDLQYIFRTQNPWLIQVVSNDVPLLSSCHIKLLQQKYPVSNDDITALYLNAINKTSPRRIANIIYTVMNYGTQEQKDELRQKSLHEILNDFSLDSDKTDKCALLALCEAMINLDGINEYTCAPARLLLELYEKKSDFFTWVLAHRLLNSDQSDGLTRLAAKTVSSELLIKFGGDEYALTRLLSEPENEGVSSLEQVILCFRVHLMCGEIYFRNRNNVESLKHLELALSYLTEKKLSPKLAVQAAMAHNLCAEIYMHQKEYETALSHCSEASSLLDELYSQSPITNVIKEKIHSLMLMAKCQTMLDQDTEAIDNYNNAEQMLLSNSNIKGCVILMSEVHASKADLLERNAQTEQALNERIQAMDCLSSDLSNTDHKRALCKLLQKASHDALNLERFNLAIRYLKTARMLLEKLISDDSIKDKEWLDEINKQLIDAQDASLVQKPWQDSEQNTDEFNQISKENSDSSHPFESDLKSKNGQNIYNPSEEKPSISIEELHEQIKRAEIALQAMQYFAVIDTLLPVMEVLDDIPDEDGIKSLQCISLAYIGAQRAEEGLHWQETLLHRLQASGEPIPPSNTLAYIISTMGMVYRMRRRDHLALDSYTISIDLWRKLWEDGKEVDLGRFAATCVNRSVLLSDRKQFSSAIEDLKLAIKLRQNNESYDMAEMARLYLNLGYVYGQSGAIDEALEYSQKAIDLREKLYLKGLVSTTELSRSYLNIGILYGSGKQIEKEIENYSIAIDRLKKVEQLSHEEKQLLVKLYRYRAMSYQALGLPVKQENDLQRAEFYDTDRSK